MALCRAAIRAGAGVSIWAVAIGAWPPPAVAAECFHFDVPFGGEAVRFDGRWPEPWPRRGVRILLLVPGYNGSGEAMLSAGWAHFADRCGLALLAPTFRTSPEELKRRRGYYYPAQGSGEVIERALDRMAVRPGVRTDRILIFGFSAGAHVAHRFALWNPARVEAFAAGAAAGWDAPTRAAAKVPALIFCGEEDPRLVASQEFFEGGLSLGAPWIWRSYRGMGHQVSPAMAAMAQAFLSHYASGEKDAANFGDVQTYDVTTNAEEIPDAVRVKLPSAEIARAWQREQ
ncbi:MAG: hypothetical protein PHC88_15750 [Terrimicrobiaceae bacterium]|nr:hypothetical protein [Terrimicrobiaceae bacterium]